MADHPSTASALATDRPRHRIDGQRLFDLALSIPILILIAPLLLLACIAVGLTSRGPVLFRQIRIGRGEQPFWMLKFRTMYVDADHRLQEEMNKRELPGEGPHTDCFQTFDSGRPSTIDVVIEDNICFDVDHQCLMAETPVRGEGSNVVFRRNICANNGSQGVLVREFDGLMVDSNVFLSTIHYHAVVLRQGVGNATIRCNLVVGRPALAEIDQTSRRGLRVTGNKSAAAAAAAPAAHAALAGAGCDPPPLAPWLELTTLPPEAASQTFARGFRP
jgi:hypothetical protein